MAFSKTFLLLLPFFFIASHAEINCMFSSGGLCSYVADGDDKDYQWSLYDPSSTDRSSMLYSDQENLDVPFLYITPKGGTGTGDYSESARMISERSEAKHGDHCFRLKYRMFGPRVGTLKVYLKMWFGKPNSTTRVLFEKSGTQGDHWNEVKVPMTVDSPIDFRATLVIEATRGSTEKGEMAIAEIHLDVGRCYERGNVRCTLWESCGWSNFTKDNPHSSWQVAHGGAVGPKTDHTSGTNCGNYALAILDDSNLSSLTVTSSKPDAMLSKNQHKCVSFYYYLGDAASLEVGMQNKMSPEGLVTWLSRDADPRNRWLRGETTVFDEDYDFMMFFNAHKSNMQGSVSTLVALDDVAVSLGECPSRGNNYFENGIGLYENVGNGQFDWIVTSSSRLKGVNLRDHTLENKRGHFALALFNGETQGNTAKLISPTFRRGEVICLQFNFYFSDENAGSLKVRYGNAKEGKWSDLTSKLSHETSSYDVDWDLEKITLKEEYENFQIVFEAKSNGVSGFVAIDDIIVTDISCLDVKSQIDWSLMLPAHVPDAADCNFEDNNLCKWTQMTKLDFDLEVSKAGRGSEPGRDHHGKGEGIILLTPSTAFKNGQGGIISPVLSGNTEGHCLSLWYYLRGRGVSIQILSAIIGQSEDTLIWQRPHDEGAGWQLAEVVIKAKTNFQIKITMKKLSEQGTAAVDEIMYSAKECSVKEINTIDTCDFETGLCGMKRADRSYRSWSYFSGSLESKGGPSGDYTYKTDQGHFLLFEQIGDDAGSIAIQEIPTFDIGKDPVTGGQICLRFHYLMFGSDIGSLEVTMLADQYFVTRSAWRASGDHGSMWIRGETQISVEEGSEVEIDFRAISGDGTAGIFGLDDITFRHGKCSSPGSCNFYDYNFCSWHTYSEVDSGWSIYFDYFGNNYAIEFNPDIVTANKTNSLVSETFLGDQVRCIHFTFAHVAGDGNLFLSRIPTTKKADKQLLWQMVLSHSKSFQDFRPARVSVDSPREYKIHISAESFSNDFDIRVDNIMVTSQPCLVEPAEAVSFDCDFTDGICFWYQDLMDDFDWVITPGSPFAYLEPAFRKKQAVGRLYSPVIPAGERCFTFSYLRYGADIGYLKLDMEARHKRVNYIDWQGGDMVRKWAKTSIDLTSEDNYQLVFEGMCKDGEDCEIGITNIVVSSSKCPDSWNVDSENPHCTFEPDFDPLCQWTATPSNHLPAFTWKHEGGFDKTDPEAPAMDVTFGGAGHYAYVAPPLLLPTISTKLVKTTLMSPPLKSRKDGPYCMVFAYYMKRSSSGTLNIYQVASGTKGANGKKPLWTAFVSDNKWRKGFASLEKMDTFQVIFEAVASPKTIKGLAIDEIYFHRGPCKEWKDKCDFSDDLCLWSNVGLNNSFAWVRHRYEQSLDDGPLADHTKPGSKGFFLVASNKFADKGEKAKLLSTMYYPNDDTGKMCLQFYYFMSGKGSVDLNVNVLRGFKDTMEPETSISLWDLKTEETKRKEWLKATVKLDEFLTEVPFKLEFQVTMDNGSVAIDDVQMFSKECETTPDNAISVASVLTEASCSFNRGSMCGWQNAPTSASAPKWEVKEYILNPDLRRNTDFSSDSKYLSVSFTYDNENEVAVLKSPSLPGTDGVECFRFWYKTDSYQEYSLQVQMSFQGSKKALWYSPYSYSWHENYISIYNTEIFQIYIQANGPGNHYIEDIRLFSGPCPKEAFTGTCRFDHSYCGYSQDTTDDYDWALTSTAIRRGYSIVASAIRPVVEGHLADEKARIKSPIYAGGGPQCLTFTYKKPAPISGQMKVYAQEVGKKRLGKALWKMPYLKTLDYLAISTVSVPVFQTLPYQIVMEHQVGVVNGYSPLLLDIGLRSHPCEPVGSCDFEDGFCSFQSNFWYRYTLKFFNQRRHSRFPVIDHTYGAPEGSILTADFALTHSAQLTSPILSKTSNSCLTFAYALTGSAFLEIFLDVDTIGKTSLINITDTTVYGQVVQWKVFKTDIQAEENFVVIIEGQRKDGDSPISQASLDDIKVMPGSCDKQTSSVTITDERPEIIQDLSCNFEDASNEFCKYKLGKENHGSWKRIHGNLGLSSLAFDHTRNDTKGSFASMVSNSGVDFAEAELVMVSQVQSQPGCLSFWYHMSGHTLNTLKVFVGDVSPIWEISNQENIVWQHAQIDMSISKPQNAQGSTEDDKELFAFKFEGILVQNHGHVALDDIQVFTGNCPITDTCTFEDDGLCNFTQNNYDVSHWMRKKAGDITDDTTHQPYTDHTYNSIEGHFMYCCSKNKSNGPVSMISPLYKTNPEGRCLIFWSIQPRITTTSIQVMDKEGHKTELMELYQSSSWTINHISIRSHTDFQIVFRRYNRNQGDTAIDDVQITSGPCHELYNCDFSLNFCTWTQAATGNGAWQISSGIPPAGQTSIGPKFDHSTKSAAGQYVILQGVDQSISADVSTLNSQIIGSKGSIDLCFTFWYHMSDSKAGSLSVALKGGTQMQTWGPFNHDEDGWLHEMITMSVKEKVSQISIIGTVQPGKENYIALDDLELLGTPCVKVQQGREFSCKDSAKTKILYEKVCDFFSDCGNDADEKECGSCSFEETMCRFVDVSDGSGWERKKANSSAMYGPEVNANGYFLYLQPALNRYGTFETSNSFKMSAPHCKLLFKLYCPPSQYVRVKIKTHMDEALLQQSTSEDWELKELFIGNINVPFQLVFEGFISSTGGIGIDDIEMVDCGFPSAQDKCFRDQFHCDNKACVSDYTVCDLQNDCGDFSDEKHCENWIRDDFEYGFGSWTTEQTSVAGIWLTMKLRYGDLTLDHTRGLFPGSVLQCYSDSHSDTNEADCLLASPVLSATNDTDLKACQIRFFYTNEDEDRNEISIYTRVKGSTDLEKISYTLVKEGVWNRVRATVSKDTDFQIIIKGTLKKDFLSDHFKTVSLDDISLTDGCKPFKDSADTDITDPITDPITEIKLGTPPSATFVKITEPSESIDVPKVIDTPPKSGISTTEKPSKSKRTTAGTPPYTTAETRPQTVSETHGTIQEKETGTTTRGMIDRKEAGKVSSGKVTKNSPEQSQGKWQLPVGISCGVVVVVIIAAVVVIYLKRTNRMFSHRGEPFGYPNQLYNQDEEPQEMSETNYGTNEMFPDMDDPLPQSTGFSLENPSFQEFES
ncbi:hypothetical protein RRG08_010991 [Elysia crispata]|uniref:MAM domain-containing protein n=1 Tax=Elysia crispata TaxID=231223 RepID=A0AAE0ZRP3_9GAST|nr:hypothetical protein RRG08_010991 [Elysia crispata]